MLPAKRQFEVLEHRELLEHGRLLKFSADARLRDFRFGQCQEIQFRPKMHASRIRTSLASDDVHHGGLARAVRSDDAAQLAGLDSQGEFVERLEAVEADGQVLEIEAFAGTLIFWMAPACPLEFGAAPSSLAFSLLPETRPMIPRGRNSVTSTNNVPSA